jgi:hypothetical protein
LATPDLTRLHLKASRRSQHDGHIGMGMGMGRARRAAFALGCERADWWDDALDSAQLDAEWADLTAAQRAAAAELGHSASSWWLGLGPFGGTPECETCDGAPDLNSTTVIWSHASQPVDYCQSCFCKLAAEERVGFEMTHMRERAAWYARNPEFCLDSEAVYMGDL